VAVLPLQNLSPDPNDEYFADGMTEELISTISKISELSVISRTSVMEYKKKGKKAAEIARELNVGTLLEGSVRKAANRVRISVQLIDAESDRHVWAENYDRNLEDIFAVQSEVAEKVASSLRVKLTEEAKRRIEKGGTSSIEAYILYLKGRVKFVIVAADSTLAAIKYFEQALELDPDYALAYCGLARAHAGLGFLDAVEPKVAYQKAEKYARKALELDDSLAEAHLALASSLMNTYDFKTQERELKRTIELNPNLASAHAALSNLYEDLLRWEECLSESEKAVELDPVACYGGAGTHYLYAGQYEKVAGRYEKAVKYLKAAVELEPDSSFYLDNLGLAYVTIGRVEEGLAMVQRASEMDGPRNYGDLAWAYVKAQRPEEAKKLLTVLGAEERKHTTAIAGVYAVLGEKEKAIDWLEKAYDERSGYLVAVGGDFVYENLREEPRYQALLEKLGIKRRQWADGSR
jgi:TolB-like protein/Tfp pilus assembly protein PilF